MKPDFSRRSDQSELMDDEDVDYATFRDCLHDLAQVNVVTLGHRPTLAFLRSLQRTGRFPPGRPLRILDVGSGYGDLLRAIDRWASRRGLAVELTGVDLNRWSAQAAREATRPGRPIDWVTADVFDHDGRADVIVSSLFTHHLDDAHVVAFLRWMDSRAELAWFVNDLHRHPLAYALFRPLAATFRWHRFVRHDGPVSILRAFAPADWRRLLGAAGTPGDIRWRFPFRLCVGRVKSG